ncbi:MAG: hypothetical protein C4K58_00725 [Flavobacteriaceae bacterium]|nr:MAG: hypothetical protein C4K58_00725 [Flavobacteriaceae bacterium]
MKDSLRNNFPWFFLLPVMGFLFFGLYFLLLDQAQLILQINSFHTPFWDKFYALFTNLGDGFMMLPILIFFIFRKPNFVTPLIYVALLQLVMIVLSKNFLWPNTLRPWGYFHENLPNTLIHLADGVKVHSHDTFPSGHTLTIFSVMYLLCLLYKFRPFSQVLLFLLALWVGFSRIYLFQHFFIDVYFGAFFGVLLAHCAILLWRITINSSSMDLKILSFFQNYRRKIFQQIRELAYKLNIF